MQKAGGAQMIRPNLATVTEVLANPPRVKIRVDGEDTALQKSFRYLANYTPSLGDRVYFVRDSGSYIIIGALK